MIRHPLLFFLVLITFVALIIQVARWKHAAETEKNLAQSFTGRGQLGTDAASTTRQKWLEQVSDAERKRRRLETRLLWKEPEALLPALGKISDKLSLSLVGVEELREWRRGDYGALPLQLTFIGTHGVFSTLLSVIERIAPTVRIEEARIYKRKRRKDALRMSLTLAPTRKTVESDEQVNHSPRAAIKMPAIERFSVKRNPFAFDLPASPQPNNARHRVKETPLPQLTGILWDDANPIAILNYGDKRLSAGVGEAIAGATVLSIQRRRVIVKRGARRHELELWKMKNSDQLPVASD